MNNFNKFEDIHSELYNLYSKDRIPKIQFKNLITNIKRYIDRCVKEEHDEYYYDILDTYNDLEDILTKTTSKGTIKKILFNNIFKDVHNRYNIKKTRIQNSQNKSGCIQK